MESEHFPENLPVIDAEEEGPKQVFSELDSARSGAEELPEKEEGRGEEHHYDEKKGEDGATPVVIQSRSNRQSTATFVSMSDIRPSGPLGEEARSAPAEFGGEERRREHILEELAEDHEEIIDEGGRMDSVVTSVESDGEVSTRHDAEKSETVAPSAIKEPLREAAPEPIVVHYTEELTEENNLNTPTEEVVSGEETGGEPEVFAEESSAKESLRKGDGQVEYGKSQSAESGGDEDVAAMNLETPPVVAEGKPAEEKILKRARWNFKSWLSAAVVGGIVIVGGVGYVFLDARDADPQAAIGTTEGQFPLTDREKVIQAVGKLAALPQGEDPTIATVVDLGPLQGQEFFENARVGFKVLIYTQARRAYLYDPASNLLVNVAPVIVEDEPAAGAELQQGLEGTIPFQERGSGGGLPSSP